MCSFSRGVLPIGPDSVDASPSLPLTPSFSPPPSHLILISIFSTGSCRLCTPSPSLTPVSKRRKAHLRRLDRRWTLGGMVNRQHSREEKYITVQPYTSQSKDEIGFEKGVTVEVIRKNLEGWWYIR
uniref:SH3 and PX domain-containing protein 2A-like n=1 Tax=Castor canadensis TaxID=51338 RepID=A0A8B7UCX2_CASCN|nr:SH3 and PX domain-containing protein 2A-like [Castor canadensis]